MSLPNITPRSFISYRSSQDTNQTAAKPSSDDDGSAQLREPANPAVADFLNNIGLDASYHSMGAEYPGDRPIPANEERQLIKRFSKLLYPTRTNRADGNNNAGDEAPAVRPPATLDNRIPSDPQAAATNSMPPSFPNVWTFG